MHAGENRPDGRHWCAPDTAPEGEVLVFCDCGKVWSYEPTLALWTELREDDVLPAIPQPGEPEDMVPVEEPIEGTVVHHPDEERTDEVDV